MFKELLMEVLAICIAPILYHASVDGNATYYALLLIDTVDAFSSFILGFLALSTMLISLNLILKGYKLFRTFTSNLDKVEGRRTFRQMVSPRALFNTFKKWLRTTWRF